MPKKNKIIVTGGAGFVGTNLIKLLLKKTKYKIISIDNYSSGNKANHIKHSRIKYISGNTANISKIINQLLIDRPVSYLLLLFIILNVFRLTKNSKDEELNLIFILVNTFYLFCVCELSNHLK